MYEKNRDTLDVWFDSGTTHQTVLRGSHAAQSHFPADLYLEGSDQHRGWFHSSLLTSSMLNGRPPYKALLTHGFVVDGEGKKMSKSLGNVVAPQKISDTLGADILRLWVAVDRLLGRAVDLATRSSSAWSKSYRRIRNTLRFLLANTSDFDPAQHAVPVAEMLEIDRYAIARMAAAAGRHRWPTTSATNSTRWSRSLQNYCSEDLGGFYLDILKDRLYTSGADSLARRSAQTALWHITHALLRVMAPILSFTAEEAWADVRRRQKPSRQRRDHLHPDLSTRCPRSTDAAALLAKYAALREVRADVTKQLEEVRVSGAIGSSLQAELTIKAGGDKYSAAGQPGRRPEVRADHLAGRRRRSGRSEAEEAVTVTPRPMPKNASAAGTTAPTSAPTRDIPACAARCVSNLFGAGEARRFA